MQVTKATSRITVDSQNWEREYRPKMRLFIAVDVTETVRRSEKFFNGLKKAVGIWLISICVMAL